MGTFMHASEGEMVCTSTNVKIPYFNAPIYLENKTAVGKVDEILGPINQVYFTIKPQEGIVATSFKNGDKFYIGGDKLLPLERYTFPRKTYYSLDLTYPPDSCPSPSPLLVLPRSRSPLVVEAREVGLETEAEEASQEAVVLLVAGPLEAGAEAALAVVEAGVAALLAAVVTRALAAFRAAVVGARSEVVDVEAIKCMHSHVDTPKSAKHEGVYRQRRHGVMRPRTAWEMVRKEALFRKEAVHLMFYAVQDYFEYREEEQKNYFNFIRFD
jgi:rRNA processing protein Gar1